MRFMGGSHRVASGLQMVGSGRPLSGVFSGSVRRSSTRCIFRPASSLGLALLPQDKKGSPPALPSPAQPAAKKLDPLKLPSDAVIILGDEAKDLFETDAPVPCVSRRKSIKEMLDEIAPGSRRNC